MSSKIRVLPEVLVNQIAAGEVVERPGSVVKELVENALDAGARDVRIETREGGRRLIRVEDDGEGMGPDDARAALGRYATSKIARLDDLHAVATYGFRGEALPSIASVGRLRIVTRRAADLAATEIRVAGGAIEAVCEAGAPAGTLVEVADLFYNTPARLKFLKRAPVEASHVTEAVERAALARPDVGFTLVQDGRTALDARASASPGERIADVLGAALGEGLLAVALEAWGLRVRGFLSRPDRTLASARAIHLFVNGRPVRDRMLHHAIVSAARDFIPGDRYPVAVFHLTLPPDAVDVNVHPGKLEVRFREARAVHDLVRKAVLAELRRWSPVAPGFGAPGERAGAGPHADRVQESLDRFLAASARPAPEWTSARPGAPLADAAPSPDRPEGLRFLGQAHGTYLLFEARAGGSFEGLLVVDQHAAHERVLFERFRAQADARAVESQRLLVPRTFEFTAARRARLDARKAELERLGFEIEPFGGSTLAIKAVPALLEAADLEALLGEIADDLAEGDSPEAVERAMRRALATLACHAAVRAGNPVGPAQAEALIAQMEGTQGSGTCPHGRPAAIRFPLGDLERMFRRT
jgi:DNA mismatch repair protein MutL